jgi:hypothetical protein
MTFPDEKMIEAFRANVSPRTDAGDVEQALTAALTDYRTRTGIDVGDVIAKLSAGTHTLAPIEPDAAMLQTADDVLKAIYSDDHVRSEMSFMWMKVHRAVARANLIHAAQEKAE